MQAHKRNVHMHMGSHFDFKGFFKVSLPAFEVPANNQSTAASSLDPEVAFGLQQEWEVPLDSADQIIKALQLWGVPGEAWPNYLSCYYKLQKKGHPDIHVYLRRQMFTTTLAHEKHTYFSF